MGNGAYILNTQGVNIITNIYFGVTANAARGVANQVNSLMMQFVNNFTTAINPQITKSYATGDIKYLEELICKGSKYSFYLMLFFLVPFMFEIEFVLTLWLKNYPPLSPLFLRLMLVGQMIDFLGNTTARAVWATGKVKTYYITTGIIGPLVFPLSFAFFSLGFSAEWSYWSFIIIYTILIPIRLVIMKNLLGIQPMIFYRQVLLKVCIVTITSFVIPGLLFVFLEESTLTSIIIMFIGVVSVGLCIYFFGLDHREKLFLKDMLLKKCMVLIKK